MTTPDKGAASEDFDPMKTMYPPQRKEGDAKCTARPKKPHDDSLKGKTAPEGPTPTGSGDVARKAAVKMLSLFPTLKYSLDGFVGMVEPVITDAIARATASLREELARAVKLRGEWADLAGKHGAEVDLLRTRIAQLEQERDRLKRRCELVETSDLLVERDQLRADIARLTDIVKAYKQQVLKHCEFGSLFQPGGRFHKEANLTLGSSAVTKGGKWLVDQYDRLTRELEQAKIKWEAEFDAKQKDLDQAQEVRDEAFEAIKKLVIRAQELDRFWHEATDNNEFLRREQDAFRTKIAELETDKRRLDNGLCVALQGLERIQRRAFGRETPQSIELQNMAGDILAAITAALDAGKGER